jgi:acyl-CoA thioester hydrolase
MEQMNQNNTTKDITDLVILPYERQANYYETDQMGVIHHSNYIRWFEEARIDYLEKIGLGYDKMEAMGIISPVLGISCEYKSSVKFYDKVIITPKITYFNGLKMTISYTITDANTNQIRTTGESKHCFVNKDFKPINMKKSYHEVYDLLTFWTSQII